MNNLPLVGGENYTTWFTLNGKSIGYQTNGDFHVADFENIEFNSDELLKYNNNCIVHSSDGTGSTSSVGAFYIPAGSTVEPSPEQPVVAFYEFELIKE